MHKVAFVFPGQGSQHIGMGKALCESYPYVRELFAKADAALGYSIAKLCFDGPDTELVRTENTQPALLSCAVAAAEVLKRELGLLPSLTAGNSLGEYAAWTSPMPCDWFTCVGALCRPQCPKGWVRWRHSSV